ncbi:MAG: hypothetical protein HUU50_09705 [Candidatus Brocadiae bacterium]|nr:hypothetical protein [Candidatus Brocadiia bacterium]
MKILKILLWIFFTLFCFVSFSALMLWKQGLLSEKGWNILLGKEKKASHSPATEEVQEKNYTLPLPVPFTFEEVSQIIADAQNRKIEYQKKMQELEKEKEEIEKAKKDIEEQKKEVKAMMEKATTLLMEVQEKRQLWKEEVLEMDETERQNLKKMAKLFSSMELEAATKRISQMDNAMGAKILSLMPAKNASQILGLMDVEKVKVLTELMPKASMKVKNSLEEEK